MSLPRSVFSKRPVTRRAFAYGTVAFFDGKPAGAAVVVSKKVARLAAVRNRIRRRVRHALPSPLTVQAVVYPRADAATAPFEKLKASLAEVLSSR